jgi:3-(3-hydroxy-phenyl)propionate hydroxylase
LTRTFTDYPFTWRRHAPARPDGNSETRDCPVIVGAGPVGLALALGLARHGIASVVIEADESVCTGSRAICISRRSLEIIEQLGALPAFLAKGLAWTGGRSYYRNDEVLRFAMPHDAAQRLPPMINIQQYYIEQFLLDACVGHAGLIDIRWQSRVTAIEPFADGSTLTIATPAGEYLLRAPWIVGCDGARSLVREAAGLKLEGTSYEGRYVIADIHLKSARPVERLAWFDPPSNPGSTILMHRQPDDIWRIDYQLRDDENPEQACRPENVIPRIESHLRMIGEGNDWSPIWISLYKANALTLNRYVQGRLLLAGDAAHLVPIFGVRGANSGIEDAHALAWRLALVVKGAAPPALLESYSQERVHAARENLKAGIKSTEFMSPPSFAFDLMRTAALSLAVDHPWVRSLINPRQTTPAAYPQDAARLPAQESQFRGGPAPGCVLQEMQLRSANGSPNSPACGPLHLTQLLTPAFTLLLWGDAPPELAQPVAALRQRGIDLRVVSLAGHAADGEALDAEGHARRTYHVDRGGAYLVRPDGHVLARWQNLVAAEVVLMIERELHHE